MKNEQDSRIESFEEDLNKLCGGRVLDVATGGGGFITYLVDNLKDYGEITGIDINADRLEAARKAHHQENIHFLRMDAARMDFPDDHFDTVCMAYSMHHMTDLVRVLAEMIRVCKPGGRIIINETFRDGQSETQLTNVLLHDWWAAVDTAEGIPHEETFTRQEVLDLIQNLSIYHPRYYEEKDLETDPIDPEMIRELDSVIDRFIQRSQAIQGGEELCRRGEELRQRVHEVGFHGATSLIMIGEKQVF
jgi:SAM-dependent methyltransferase